MRVQAGRTYEVRTTASANGEFGPFPPPFVYVGQGQKDQNDNVGPSSGIPINIFQGCMVVPTSGYLMLTGDVACFAWVLEVPEENMADAVTPGGCGCASCARAGR